MDRIWLERTLEESECQIDIKHGKQMQAKVLQLVRHADSLGESSDPFADGSRIPVDVVKANKAAYKIRAATG
jgi:hypothetical protein